jgi:protoporphyrinogen IX oxidase
MNEFATGLIPHFKGLHIAALVIWCGGLFALPLLLARHDAAIGQSDYSRIRRVTHYGYIFAITPAALIAIGSGTALIFLREVYVPWLFAKLVFVALLVAFHAWVGHTLVEVAETEGTHVPPEPALPLTLLLVPILAILTLVLAKPDLQTIPLPEWLMQPYGGQFPFEVPNP